MKMVTMATRAPVALFSPPPLPPAPAVMVSTPNSQRVAGKTPYVRGKKKKTVVMSIRSNQTRGEVCERQINRQNLRRTRRDLRF